MVRDKLKKVCGNMLTRIVDNFIIRQKDRQGIFAL